jgi:hypothetical protein
VISYTHVPTLRALVCFWTRRRHSGASLLRERKRVLKMLFGETGAEVAYFLQRGFSIDGAALPKQLCVMQWKASSQKNVEHRTGWGESPVEDQVRAAGQVSDRRLREGPCRRRGAASRQAGEEGLRLCRQSRLRLQSKTSMEIRKKLNAILSSKSRLAKAPRLKGATWVLRADC